MGRAFRDPEVRQSIGDFHVDKAINEINKMMRRAVAVMTSYSPSRDETIRMLFRDEDIAIAKAARGLIEPESERVQYTVADNVYLNINHEGTSVPLRSERLYMQPDRDAPLLTFIKEVRVIYEQYNAVKAMLRWLNRHATPGAARYYWPPVLKLCRQSPALKELSEVPTRYVEPQGINQRLQMLSDTSTTLAAAAMLPADVDVRGDTMFLTFGSYKVQPYDDPTVFFDTDSAYFNI